MSTKKKSVPTSIRVDLSVPLEIAGAKVGHLELRYPTVKDRLDADGSHGSESDRELLLMARLAGIAPDDLHPMHLADYRELQVALGKFMGVQ